ncbi:MAG: LPP20 family lipoprotein [Natronospirillum sp.]
MSVLHQSTRFISLLILPALLLAACGGRVDSDAPPPCEYPGTSERAPGWVCDQPVSHLELSAVGSYPQSGAGVDFMRQQAASSARVQLAQAFTVHVQNMVKQYAETTGMGETETVDLVNTSVSRLITDEYLSGSRIFDSRVAPDGALYVLVGMDDRLAQQNTERALRNSMNNDNALWQQFRAEQGFHELDEQLPRRISEGQR